MIWSKIRPPKYKPDAVLTRTGWKDPVTGELLVYMHIPWLGPGKNIRQEQRGQSCIKNTTTRHQSGTSRIAMPPIKRKTQSISGRSKIICPMPFDTGINPNW